MGLVYGGLVGNINYPSSTSIISSVAGSPTIINTLDPHGLATGDIVDIYGHTVNTGANGVNLAVTYLSANQFSVVTNTTGYTSGGFTGSVQPKTYTQNRTTVPSAGDPNKAATF